MKSKVVITSWVHPEVIDLLSENCELILNQMTETLDRDEILTRAQTAQALMVFMSDNIDEDFLRQCPNLQIISAALKGYDNFDVEACTRHGVWFTIIGDLLTAPTADLAMGLIINLARRLAEGDRFVRSGEFKSWQAKFYSFGLVGRTLGIVGMGAVGRAVAKRATAFGMNIRYYDVNRLSEETEKNLSAEYCSFKDLLEQSDFLLPLLPLNSSTFHLFNAETLSKMKKGSFLVNVGRGSVVDEPAIAHALKSGHLGGYAADVFEMEDWHRIDRPLQIPQELLESADQTFFTPHLGSAVDEVRREISMAAARSILQALHGEKPNGAVNDPLRAKRLSGAE